MVEVLLDARVTARGHSGIGRYVRELARRLGRHPGLRLSTIQHGDGAALDGSAECVRARSRFLAPTELLEIPLLATRWRLGRSNTVTWVPAYDASPAIPGRLVLTIHDANHLAFPEQYGPQHALYYRTVVRAACRRATLVMTPSEFARREVIERIGCDPDRIVVTGAGVSPPPMPDAADVERVRAEWRLPERYVAYVGNFKPHKNLPTLLRAASAFADEAALVLVGGTEAELGNAAAAARSNGARVQVVRALPESDLWPFLAGAEVFAFPSRYEGFGLPPLEAMSLGVPVVTTTAGSIPEVVGDAAITVDPDDVESLGQAIARLLADPAQAESLRARGRQRATAWGWDVCAERVARVLFEAAR